MVAICGIQSPTNVRTDALVTEVAATLIASHILLMTSVVMLVATSYLFFKLCLGHVQPAPF